MKNRSLLTLVLFSFLFIGFSTTSCKKDKGGACTNFPVLDGQITVNNTSQKLSIAQFSATQNLYVFQLASVSDDCNKQNILKIYILFFKVFNIINYLHGQVVFSCGCFYVGTIEVAYIRFIKNRFHGFYGFQLGLYGIE